MRKNIFTGPETGGTYISNRELEELGEGLTRHYLENAHVQMAARCIDIEGLANYLGMTVVFETFAEEDRDKVGFLADGRTPLKIRRKGSIVSFCFPLGTIVTLCLSSIGSMIPSMATPFRS